MVNLKPIAFKEIEMLSVAILKQILQSKNATPLNERRKAEVTFLKRTKISKKKKKIQKYFLKVTKS